MFTLTFRASDDSGLLHAGISQVVHRRDRARLWMFDGRKQRAKSGSRPNDQCKGGPRGRFKGASASKFFSFWGGALQRSQRPNTRPCGRMDWKAVEAFRVRCHLRASLLLPSFPVGFGGCFLRVHQKSQYISSLCELRYESRDSIYKHVKTLFCECQPCFLSHKNYTKSMTSRLAGFQRNGMNNENESVGSIIPSKG